MPMTLDQFIAALPSRRKRLPGVQSCALCRIPLQESLTGCRYTDKGYVCSDCYFQELSDELEQFPIFMPRVHRT